METWKVDLIKAILGSTLVASVGRGLWKWSKERSARMFTFTSKVYREVNSAVKETTIEFIARRTTISEIHNGGVWLSNHPIYRITITHDAPRTGVKSVAHQVKEQITTGATMQMLIDLDKNKTLYIPDTTGTQFDRFGSRSIYMAMLKSRKNRPMGVFTVAFDRPNMLSAQDIDLLTRRVHHIEELMQ